MEENEDEPDDVRKATPVEEEIARGEIDEPSGRASLQPIELARKRHQYEKGGTKKLKNDGECCREKAAKAARAPKTASVLVYEKECILPKIKAIPRHCLTKEEWIDILATPSRKCPPPCLQREVTRRIRPVSIRMTELAQPPKNRLLNTLQDRAATLPIQLVDNLIQALEGEACLTPEQAERMFRDKDIRTRKKCRKRKNKVNCKGKKLSKHEEPENASNCSSIFDKEAVNCQYKMAESFVKSILEWKCPIPKEEFKDISEVILKRLGYVLEYNPVNGEDRKSQQMRFLADIVASWISGVLFDVAQARRMELEEECERRRKEKEEESEEESDDESVDEFDEDDNDDERKDQGKKKGGGGSSSRKGNGDNWKKGHRDGKDDDDDDDEKHGKSEKRKESKNKERREEKDDGIPGTEDAEQELMEDGIKELAGGIMEEDESKPGTKDPTSEVIVAQPQEKEGVPPKKEEGLPLDDKDESDDAEGLSKNESKDDTVDGRLIPEEPWDGVKRGEDSQARRYPESDTESGIGTTVISSDNEEYEKGIIDEKTLNISNEATQEILTESTGIEEERVQATTVVDISESLAESKKTEATPMAIDENIVSEMSSKFEIAEKVAMEAGRVDEDEEATTKRAETDERAAGDRKYDKELPVEPTKTPKTSEISETKRKEFIPVDAGDANKEIHRKDAILAAPPEDTTPILVDEIRKEFQEDEAPRKIVETMPGVRDKGEPTKRKSSKIPSSIVLIKRKKFQTDMPFVTFDKIFHTIYNAIEESRENPGTDTVTNRIHRAVYEKCSSVVKEEKPEPLPELTKDVLDVLSGKIALWLRDVLTESQLSFMNKFPAAVESVDVREWTKWIGYVSDTANNWSTWIQKTIKQAEGMRSGRVTRGDWHDWTKSVEEEALLWRRFYVQSLHQAHQNLTMIRDRRVVKTGTRDLPDGDYEKEIKITDL